MRARQTLFVVILAAASSACSPGYPVRVRPGSNLALPDDRGFVGNLVDNALCEKTRKKQKGSAVQQCGVMRPDTLPARGDTVPLVPPQSRP